MSATFRKIVVLSIAMFALWGATVGAETTTLIVADHGILGAMRRVGCHDPRWLGRVMIDSGVLESQSDRLPLGTPISIPDACVNHEAPTRADSLVTQRVFANWALLERARAMANTPVTSREIAANAEALDKSGRGSVIASSIIALLIGFAFGLGGAWNIINRRSKRKAKENEYSSVTPREEYPASVEFHGRVISFRDTTPPLPSPTLGCPFCKETRIRPTEESMVQHLTKVHPELRVMERELPPEMEQHLIRIG